MEIEAKFAIPNAEVFQRLRVVKTLAGFALGQARETPLADTYQDTADGRLRAAGYLCRQRVYADGRVVMTLKGLQTTQSGAIQHREEFEVALDAPAPPAQWPESPVRERVLALSEGAPLVPLCRLTQQRVSREVRAGARAVASLSLDEVQLTAGARVQTYLILEVELLPAGDEAELAVLAEALQEEWALAPEPRTKFELARAWQAEEVDGIFCVSQPTSSALLARLLGMPPSAQSLTLPEQPGILAEDTLAEAARKTLLFHFQRVLYHEPGTHAGDVAALHDMRVAIRRMRAAARLFADYLDPKQLQPYVKWLRRTGRSLGEVRDLDVFWEKTAAYLSGLPEASRPDLTPLRVAWEGARNEARTKMLYYLDSRKYRRTKECLGAYLETSWPEVVPPLTAKGEALPHLVRDVLPVLVYQRVAHVLAYAEWFTQGEQPLERYHRLRIACKYLRYTLEYFREVLPSEAGPLINKVKGMQDYLGDLQDAVVASNILRDFMLWGRWGHTDAMPSPPAPGVAAYLTVRQTELQRLLVGFPAYWDEFRAPPFKQRLAEMVASIGE